MKITFLGTNGWFDNNNGSTICTLVETSKEYIILDAGFGLYKAKKYITKNKPIYLFISHTHLDHICGLHGLSGLRPKQGLTIICSKISRLNIAKIISKPFTFPLKNYKFLTNYKIVKPGKYTSPFNFEVTGLKHNIPTLGIKIKADNKIVTYCCDTAPCPNDIKLAQNADILIHECSLLPGDTSFKWGHTSPDQAGKLAKLTNAKKLFLTHFDAVQYASKDKFGLALKTARKHFPNTFLAKDDVKIKI